MMLGVVLSLIGGLLFQFPFDSEDFSAQDIADRLRQTGQVPLPRGDDDQFQTLPHTGEDPDWDDVERDCVEDCPFPLDLLPDRTPVVPPPPGAPWQPPPGWSPPTVCDPSDPSPPVPDVTQIDWPEGEITHAAGDGDVVVGMDTEFHWDGPMEVSWTQRGRAGVREDCSLIPGPVETFTARAETVMFDFETGDQLQYLTDDRTVTHRYTEVGVWTVCVYVAFDVDGSDSAGLVRLAELDHDVVEIRSTLVE